MADGIVSHVSDTALWVAQYRANESARPDAIFHDPLAARLAGERGRAIAATAPKRLRSGWSIVARTKLIDDLVLACVAEGCDRVVNLAAGLDTRPYRLPLPSTLTWLEADLPAVVDEKERLLAGETPRCALAREKVDLSDEAARRTFLARAAAGAARALVVTEGLLGYLDAEVARALGSDLAAEPAFRWWVLDLFSPGALAMIKATRGHQAAPLLGFAPRQGVGFFEALGWRALEVHAIARAAGRLGRLPWPLRPLLWLPDPDPRRPGKARWFGVVRLARAPSA
jgi:methyltransferase (TIGR00027 family)